MSAVPYHPQTPVTPLQATGAGDAIRILQTARSLCIHASYHPAGGASCLAYVPVTHTVWVLGTPDQITELKSELEKPA